MTLWVISCPPQRSVAMIICMGRPRQIACHLGHPLSPANVRYNGSGAQECQACHRRRSRAWARRHRASQPTVDNKSPPTIALVVWGTDERPALLRASWTYRRSRAAAAKLAPTDGTPFSIVDVARKPWIKHRWKPRPE
jgi:hypothetical protein